MTTEHFGDLGLSLGPTERDSSAHVSSVLLAVLVKVPKTLASYLTESPPEQQ